jgi:hypothetical protein
MQGMAVSLPDQLRDLGNSLAQIIANPETPEALRVVIEDFFAKCEEMLPNDREVEALKFSKVFPEILRRIV